MINRSILKYVLKKFLPKIIFAVVLFMWQKLVRHIVTFFDSLRIKRFAETRLVTLEHNKKKFSLYISPENGFIDKHIFLYGVYEPFILDIIEQYLHKGMTFIDIGANIGQHSMYAASLVGKSGSVHSFEPIPRIYGQLIASSHSNGFTSIIHAHNVALGTQDTTETFFISKNIGGSSLVNQNEETKEEISVRVTKGDTLLLPLSRIDMIKIDVEGYEYEVLLGIKQTLATRSLVILVEFSGDFYHTHTDNHGIKILSLLEEAGYQLYDIEDTMKEIINKESFDTSFKKKRIQTNILCLKSTKNK